MDTDFQPNGALSGIGGDDQKACSVAVPRTALVELSETFLRMLREARFAEGYAEKSGSAFLIQDCRELVSELYELIEKVERRLREGQSEAAAASRPGNGKLNH